MKVNLSSNIIAYRTRKTQNGNKGKSNVDYAKELFEKITEIGECVVITTDIVSFFDSINHKILLNAVKEISHTKKLDDNLYKVLKSLCRYRYIDQKVFKDKKIKSKIQSSRKHIYEIVKNYVEENRSGKGIPQGSPISGLLANVYLIKFDKSINGSKNIFYRRYSDDLALICKKGEEKQLLETVNMQLSKNLLEINLSKTFLSYFEKTASKVSCIGVTDGNGVQRGREYLDYLGFEFNGENILFRKKTLQKLRHRQLQSISSVKKHSIKKNRKTINKVFNKKDTYFIRSKGVMNDPKLSRQVIKVSQSRNRIRKKMRYNVPTAV